MSKLSFGCVLTLKYLVCASYSTVQRDRSRLHGEEHNKRDPDADSYSQQYENEARNYGDVTAAVPPLRRQIITRLAIHNFKLTSTHF